MSQVVPASSVPPRIAPSSSSPSLASPPPSLPDLLPPNVASLRKSVAEAVTRSGRRALSAPAPTPGAGAEDFGAFLIADNSDQNLNRASGGRMGGTRRTSILQSALSSRVATTITSASRKVLPSASYRPSSVSPSESSRASLGASSGFSSRSSFGSPAGLERLPYYCEAFAYVHETPAELGRQIADAASPFFLLRAGRAGAQGPRRGESERLQADETVGGRLGCRNDGVHALDPLVLAEGGEGLFVVMYKQIQAGSRNVIELLHKLVIIDGPGGEVCIYFMPLDEESLAETDLEAANTLDERRRAVMAKGYSVDKGSCKETCFLVLTPDAIGLTQAHMVVSAEYGIELEEKNRLKLLGRIFAPLLGAQRAHDRSDWVDMAKARHFVSVTIPRAPNASADELAMVDTALKFSLEDDQFQRVRGSLKKHPTVHMFVRQSASQSSLGKCYGDVDGAIDDVFAWIWLVCSYDRMQAHRAKNGSLLRQTDASENSRSQVLASEYKVAPNLANRWSETKYTWAKTQSGDIVVAFEPTVQVGAELFTRGAVESKSSGMCHFKVVAPQITQMTLVQTVDLGGSVPEWIMQVLVKSAFLLLLQAKEKFRRPDRVVDKEIRDIIAARIQSSGPDYLSRGHDCKKLQKDFEDGETMHLVKSLKSPSPFISYSMRPAQKAGEMSKRQVGTGKATAVVDTNAADAAAWIFDACSRDRTRSNAEDNMSLPRLISRTQAPNSFVMGAIKHAPFPLWNREFVIQMSWAKADDDRVYVWAQSVEERVDYGLPNARKVVGITSLIWEIVKCRNEMCSVSLYQKIDSGGWIPISIINKKIAGALNVVSSIRTSFQRDEEIDLENRRALIAEFKRGQLDEDERELFVSTAQNLAKDSDVVRAVVGGSSDHFVKVFRRSRSSSTPVSLTSRPMAGNSVDSLPQQEETVFEAQVLVDADIEECVAWTLLRCSRQRTQSFFDLDGGASRSEKTLSSRRRASTDLYFEKHEVDELAERREVSESVWNGSDDGSKYVVIEQRMGFGTNGKKPKNLSTSETAFSVVEAMSGSVPQTMITTKFTLDKSFGLSPPDAQIVWSGTRHFSDLRKCFDKSIEIDQIRRDVFCEIAKMNIDVYADHEIELLSEGMKMFSHFEGQVAKTIDMTPPTTVGKKSYIPGDRRAWGWSSATVRAPAVAILAWIWDLNARATKREDDLLKEYDESPNAHNNLMYVRKRSPGKSIDDRDFLTRSIWKMKENGSFDYVAAPEESEKRSRQEGVVRGTYPNAMRIVRIGDTETKLEYVIHPDSGGSIPSWVMSFYMSANLSYVTEIQEYFQRLRPLSEYDEKDGVAIGEIFMIKTTEEKLRKKGARKYQIRVSKVAKSHFALKEFSALHQWFPSLVEGMLSSRLRGMQTISTKVENLSNKEALAIGHSFSTPLRARKSAQAGSDVWINEYPALVLLAKRERFFVPMAHTIGQRKIKTAPWGLHLKVGIGAVLSLMDVATDAYAIANFTMQGKHGYASAIFSGVSVSMAIQLLIVYANGTKRGKRHLLKEALIVLSGFKPAVDAFRVIGGAKAHRDDVGDPMFELIFSKCVEIVAESIPSSLVQMYALLTTPEASVNSASIVSIVVSVTTISLGSTTICFDFDLDPERRLHTPAFYGYVPNSSGKRTVVFYSIFLFTACHVALRLLGIALLAAVSPMITVAVLGVDVMLFILLKLARRDLRYWVKLPGALSWVVSVFERLFTKMMVDFTVMVQLRHPNELGGFYWCMCLLLGQATSFVAVHLYERASVGALGGGAALSRELWGLMGGLEAAFVVFFAIFILMINRNYVGTFFSAVTAKQFNQEKFRSAATDRAKFALFDSHLSYYENIKGEVKEWVRENWDVWSEERPEWFTERAKSSVPKDMIPQS